MKTDVLIIGSGLIGSMCAKFLRDVKGMEVMIVDEKHPMGASKCSFGVWKEGWVNKVIKSEYEDGVDLLDTFTGGILEEEFIVKPKPYNHRVTQDKYNVEQVDKKEIFKRVDCSLILNEEFTDAKVLSIEGNRVEIQHREGNRKEFITAKHIVVAAGVWTTDILIENGLTSNLPYLDHQWGSVFKMKGLSDMKLPQSQMKEWSPYKQSVFVNLGKNKGFFGDGCVVKNPKKDDERVVMASNRILIHMALLFGTRKFNGAISDVLEGYRPYMNKDKSSTKKFVNKHSDYVISATGGAKNSTILCGHMAKEVWRLIKG